MTPENNSSPKKVSWGIQLYIALVFVVLYLLYPNKGGNTGSLSDLFLSFLIAVGVIVGIYIFFLWRVKRKKVKTEEEKKETKTLAVPRATFWRDWKTWVMIVFGYTLWGIGQSLCIMKGGPFHPAIVPPPDGMFYLPYSGIFYAVLLSAFFILAMRSLNGFISLFGLIFGGICVFASITGFWFAPYNTAHLVFIPVLRYIGLNGILFPSDPIISTKWIFLGFVFAYIAAKTFPKKQLDSDILSVMVIILATVLFLPQLFL